MYTFESAFARYEAMQATMGDAHPLTRRAFALAVELAPPLFRQAMSEVAAEMNLLPQAGGYLEDGSPVYNLGDIAKKLGMTEAEAQDALQAFLSDRAALGLDTGLVAPENVHRVQ